jgi:hypothetical protein
MTVQVAGLRAEPRSDPAAAALARDGSESIAADGWAVLGELRFVGGVAGPGCLLALLPEDAAGRQRGHERMRRRVVECADALDAAAERAAAAEGGAAVDGSTVPMDA